MTKLLEDPTDAWPVLVGAMVALANEVRRWVSRIRGQPLPEATPMSDSELERLVRLEGQLDECRKILDQLLIMTRKLLRDHQHIGE